jgi:hypothetical protein
MNTMNTGDTSASVERAEQRIDGAVDAIRGMSRDLADELAPSPSLLDRVAAATREAPIQALAIAFLIGFIVVRR